MPTMPRGRILLAAGFALLAPLAAAVAGPASAAAAGVVNAYDPPTSSTVSATVGDTVVLHLTTCTTCGDQWKLATAAAPELVRFVTSTLTAKPHPAGSVGFAFYTNAEFLAAGVGTTAAMLREFGPTGGAAIRTDRVTFVVTAASSVTGPTLPFTGSDPAAIAGLGGSLLVAGSLLLLAGRRWSAGN